MIVVLQESGDDFDLYNSKNHEMTSPILIMLPT